MAMAEKIQKYGPIPPCAEPAVIRTISAAKISPAASKITPPTLRSEASRREGKSSTVPTPATTQSTRITSGESGTLWANNGAGTSDVIASMTNALPRALRGEVYEWVGTHARGGVINFTSAGGNGKT